MRHRFRTGLAVVCGWVSLALGQPAAPAPSGLVTPDRGPTASPTPIPPGGARTRTTPQATLFNPEIDVKSAIDAAKARGAADRRRVLIVWGDNASRWSLRMQEALAIPETNRQIRHHYELVLADVAASGFGPLNLALARTYGAEITPGPHLKPYLTVVETIGDDAGKAVVNRSTAGMENPGATRTDGAYNALQIQNFLREHRLPLLAGEEVLSAATTRARDRGVPLLVFFNDLEDPWCARFAGWLKREEVAGTLGARFEVVTADYNRWTDGTEVFSRFGGERSEASPWYVVVDADEKRLAPDPAHGERDLGFPSGEEIKEFVRMLRRVAPSMSDAESARLEASLATREGTPVK